MTTASLPPSPADAPERQPHAPVAAWWHTALLILVIFTVSALQGRPRFLAHVERVPTRIPIYAQTLAYELLLFVYIWLLGLRPRGVRIREIIGGKWNRFEDFAIDVATAFIFWIVVVAVLAPLEYLLKFKGIEAAKMILPQSISELAAFVVLAVTAGFCEEFIFRGYLQRQFLAWTGTAWIAIVLQAIVFGAGHLYQGWRPVIAITIYGALFGILATMRKSLRPGMIQHGLNDSIGGIAGFLATKYKLI